MRNANVINFNKVGLSKHKTESVNGLAVLNSQAQNPSTSSMRVKSLGKAANAPGNSVAPQPFQNLGLRASQSGIPNNGGQNAQPNSVYPHVLGSGLVGSDHTNIIYHNNITTGQV